MSTKKDAQSNLCHVPENDKAFGSAERGPVEASALVKQSKVEG
jgi:hypothetical protein